MRSTVQALGTLSLFHTNAFPFPWETLVVRTNCSLHLTHNIFRKTNGLLNAQSQEGCHQRFAELPDKLEFGQILLVHFIIEGSGIGSYCIEEEEVGIQCPSLRFGPH